MMADSTAVTNIRFLFTIFKEIAGNVFLLLADN
jgi:hypothetical protein